jgi:hypothetical protein
MNEKNESESKRLVKNGIINQETHKIFPHLTIKHGSHNPATLGEILAKHRSMIKYR